MASILSDSNFICLYYKMDATENITTLSPL
jgi:hypothetical protein